MNQKAGYRTTEFWITVASQALSLLVALHAVAPADQKTLETAIAGAVAAVATLLANAGVVVKYIDGRVRLKQGAKLVVAALVVGTLTGAPARAQYLLPFRANHEQRLRTLEQQLQNREKPPASDPALGQALQQLAAGQQALLNHLQKQAAPQAIVLGAPLQTIPLGGAPLQNVPLGGPPLQQIPLGAPPLQQIPLGAAPLQQIPLGGAPRQQIDMGGPAPQSPGPAPEKAPTPQAQPGQPPAAGAPPAQQIPLGPFPAPMTPPARTGITHALWRVP